MLSTALLLALAATPQHDPSRLEVGAPHPPLNLPTVDGGGPLALDSFRGEKVLLIEFASW